MRLHYLNNVNENAACYVVLEDCKCSQEGCAF